MDASEDDGMTLEEFNKKRCVVKMLHAKTTTTTVEMDSKEFHRLTNDKNGMFKTWADPTNTSAIARFMREGLDPHKEYSKKEYGIQLWVLGKKSQTHAQILIRENVIILYAPIV